MLILYIVALLITPTAFCANDNTPLIDVNKTDQYGDTPLHYAVSRGDTSAVKALLAAGADVNKTNQYGHTPLHIAAQNVVAALIAAGAQVNKADKYGNTPLKNAVDREYTSAVEALIAAGADANTTNKYGDTPLHGAVARGNINIVRVLVTAGADVNIPNENDNTPLHTAVTNGNIDVVRVLIDAGADGNTLLHRAADRGWEGVLQILLAAGADVNKTNQYDKTPLYTAIDQRDTSFVKALIAAGAHLDKELLRLLGLKMPGLLTFACTHNRANLEFLERLTRQRECDPNLLKQIRQQCAATRKGRLADIYKKHGARNSIALLQNQRRGCVLPHRTFVPPALQQVSLSE